MRLVAYVVAACALSLLTSCVRVVDVTQPGIAAPGGVFEVAAIARVDADASGAARGPAYGLLAVSLPTAWEAAAAKVQGDIKDTLRRAEVPAPLPERPGYEWTVFRTNRAYAAEKYMGHSFDVIIKIKTRKAPGAYALAYAAGGAPAGDGGGVDWERADWESAEGPAMVERWLEVK